MTTAILSLRLSTVVLKRFHANISSTRVARLRGGSMVNKVKHKILLERAQNSTREKERRNVMRNVN